MSGLSGLRYILSDEGEPVVCDDLLVWGKWYENGRTKWQMRDQVGDMSVSTVFLGLNHNFGEGEPLLWETMLFNGNEDECQDQWRHHTRGEARGFHVMKVRELERTEGKK